METFLSLFNVSAATIFRDLTAVKGIQRDEKFIDLFINKYYLCIYQIGIVMLHYVYIYFFILYLDNKNKYGKIIL